MSMWPRPTIQVSPYFASGIVACESVVDCAFRGPTLHSSGPALKAAQAAQFRR